ncbi:MAG: hypothetical protein AcusKO_24760 [Acuticoccus sp.]
MAEMGESVEIIAPRPRRGRPVQLSTAEREGLILDALERIVAENGLRRASMAAIAREAGMSKRTLYAVYGSREATFAAWVSRVTAKLVRPLEAAERELPLAERLACMFSVEGCEIDGADGADRRLMVLRAVIAEAPGQPEVARAVALTAGVAARQTLAQELMRARRSGELRPLDAEAAAQLLIDMVRPNPIHLLLDPDACKTLKSRSEDRLDLAIATFLGGHATFGAPPPAEA